MYSSHTIQNNTINHSYTAGKSDTESITYMPMEIFRIIINIFIVCVGLPVNCLAICGLYRLIRSDMVVPIYIINLLIADLLQVVSRPLYIASDYENISEVLLFFGVSASVWFMVCIALERYLVVAHPLWYRYRRSVRHAALISAGVWLLALLLTVPIMLRFFWNFDPFTARLISIPNVFLLPFPLLVFFYLSTRRVIIRTHSIQDEEKKRILCMLALVLGMYTVLFLPFGIMRFIVNDKSNSILNNVFLVTSEMYALNALADPVLYIFLRSDVRNTLGSLPCCQRLFTLTNCWTPRAEQETENTDTVRPSETSV